MRSGPDAVAELTSELPELPPPFADTIAKPHPFPPPPRDTMIPFSRGLIMHVLLVRDRDRSIDRSEGGGSGGAQEGPAGDRANEMRSIANARRPGAGDEALCSSLRARARARVYVCMCESAGQPLSVLFFLWDARPLDRVDAWKQGAGGECAIGSGTMRLRSSSVVTSHKNFISFFFCIFIDFLYVIKFSFYTFM